MAGTPPSSGLGELQDCGTESQVSMQRKGGGAGVTGGGVDLNLVYSSMELRLYLVTENL